MRKYGFIAILTLAAWAVILSAGSSRFTGQEKAAPAVAPLPEGNTGLAAKYPGDAGLERDPAVIHYDGFEDYETPADVNKKYEFVMHTENMRLTEEPANVNRGKKAMAFTLPKQEEGNAAALYRIIKEERDILFLRYYAKFEKGYDQHGSSHNSGVISAHYFPNRQASPGQPADGKNKFWVSYETERGDSPSPGRLNVYVYHPEQRTGYGDHIYPTGRIRSGPEKPVPFGPGFVPRPDIIPELDRWYCYEFMVKANTPGRRDGRIACWLDGRLIADFPGFRLRDVDSLKIDLFGIALFMRPNNIRANTRWFDDVVAATSYIGPIAK
ncbi:MAG: hypothetical protein A2W03_17250 [Candidatus Aminicenantes bacterium RBG_16_63_16]|nr:MAG: hypothetical protein A2W03_17250 [Candidatus Aminicenantes bacterium RBG_16_63_16]